MSTVVAVCLDVDGVLNPDAVTDNGAMRDAIAAGRLTGYSKSRTLICNATIDSPFINEDAHSVLRLVIRHHREHSAWINSLIERGVQPYWATTWEHLASTYLSPLLGIPPLPLAAEYARDLADGLVDPAWTDDEQQPLWKATAITHRFTGRPVVWIDDKAIALNRAEPTLIVRTEETVGLTRAQMASVDEFVDTYPAKDGYR